MKVLNERDNGVKGQAVR